MSDSENCCNCSTTVVEFEPSEDDDSMENGADSDKEQSDLGLHHLHGSKTLQTRKK